LKGILANRKTGFRNESGQTLVLVVASMVALMGFVGLAIDVGNLRAAERKLQQTADAAALAGALEMNYCTYTSGTACDMMTNAATSSVKENGFSSPTLKTDTCTTPSISSMTLVVNWGPCLLGTTDPNNASQYVVEAQVGQKYGTYFASVLGLSTVTLTARAEAGRGNSGYCLYIDAKDYPSTGSGNLGIQSGGHMTLSCGIQDDGTLSSKGNGSHVTATQFEVSSSSGTGSNQFSPAPSFNAPSVPDPVCATYGTENLPTTSNSSPAISAAFSASTDNLSSYSTTSTCHGQTSDFHMPTCSSWTTWTGAISGTLSPGCYTAPAPSSSGKCSAVSVKNNGYGNDVNNYCDAVSLSGNLTLNPGVYVFNGDLDLGNSNLTGSGVTLYFQQGSIINSSNGSSIVTLTAPNLGGTTPTAGTGETISGSYDSMLIWQAPDNTNTMELASGSSSTWTGIVYVPDGILDLSDGANASSGCATGYYTIIDAYTVEDSHGSKTFNVCNDYSQLAGGDPIKGYTAVLSE
jgi:Flp pilus assembly protein TadG